MCVSGGAEAAGKQPQPQQVDGQDLAALCAQLEAQELEVPLGVATPQLYSRLLAVYLLQRDLPNAKLLWKRIPQAVKSGGEAEELAAVWRVGEALWRRDLPAIYLALAAHEWSAQVSAIMTALREDARRSALTLVSTAYTSISGDELASLLGQPTPEAIAFVTSLGWQADASTRLVTPLRPAAPAPASAAATEHQQLSRLTDYVSFLET